MKTTKRIASILVVFSVLAIAIVGPASSATAIKGERPGTVTVALRAPKGFSVDFSGTGGDFTMTGNQNVSFTASQRAFVQAAQVGDRLTAIKGHRTFMSLERIVVTRGADHNVDLATGSINVEVVGNGQVIVRYVYR